MDLNEALQKGFLAKESIDPRLTIKELKEAEYDLIKAQESLQQKDFKWAIVKAYYSMFHAARAVLFRLGYREKRHFVVPIVLEELSKQGKLESEYVTDLNAALYGREEADYHYGYSEDTAKQSVEMAENFLKRMKQLV